MRRTVCTHDWNQSWMNTPSHAVRGTLRNVERGVEHGVDFGLGRMIDRTHSPMVRGWVLLGEVIGQVGAAWGPIDAEVVLILPLESVTPVLVDTIRMESPNGTSPPCCRSHALCSITKLSIGLMLERDPVDYITVELVRTLPLPKEVGNRSSKMCNPVETRLPLSPTS